MVRRSVGGRIVRAGIGAALIVCLGAGLVVARPPGHAADAGPLAWRREVLGLMNDARSDAQVPRLRINRDLSGRAMAHTRQMIAQRRVFQTENMDDIVEPYGASLWAEELARGRTLEANVRAWLNRADTRGHLLDPRMRHAAIGVLFTNGRYWITVYLHN
jgi:uncharacterized protein YkwD